MPRPLVSVIIISYQHSQFIDKTIAGAANQKCDFPYEIICVDDGSTDGTKDIIDIYLKSHPTLIRSDSSKFNIGLVANMKRVYEGELGEYIALLDGDDEWISRDKLQTQIDILQKNQNYSGCFHDVRINTLDSINIANEIKADFDSYHEMHDYPEVYSCHEAIFRKIIPTSSLMFRSSALRPELFQAESPLSFSWKLTLILLKKGKLYFVNQQLAVYNNHRKGLTKTANKTQFKFNSIQLLKGLLGDEFYKTKRSTILESILNEYQYLFYLRAYKEMAVMARASVTFHYYFFFIICALTDMDIRWLRQAIERKSVTKT